MKHTMKFTLGFAALAALSGCVEDTGLPEVSVSAPPFITTFDAKVSAAAVTSCTNALRAQTNSEVQLAGTEYSEANSGVFMRLVSNGAPWRCLVSNDGRGPELMFMGSEGYL